MALKIGFASKHHTLWEVSAPYKHYFGGQQHDFEWRTNYTYVQNLAYDKAEAIEKAIGKGCTVTDIDENLRGRSNQSFFTTGEKGTDRPDYMFPPNIHRHGKGDIRIAGNTDYSADHVVNQDSIKALWSMYLKKSIWNEEVPAHSSKVLQPLWLKPVVYARRRLMDLGVLVRHDGQVMAASYVEKYDIKNAVKKILAECETGHHGVAGERVDLTLTFVTEFAFESQWGETHVVTYKSDDNKIYKYMGGSVPNIEEGTKIKATLKHDEYKGEAGTKIQRVKVLKVS